VYPLPTETPGPQLRPPARDQAVDGRAVNDKNGTAELDAAAVIGTTFAGIVTLWSPGAQSMFGWTAPEALGQPVGQLADWALTENDLAEFIFVGSNGAWIREHEVTNRTGRGRRRRR
jgi:PAS domain-containing protein